jgi:hypothetical protein
MQQMAEKYEGRAHFPFVYVREAHPGEIYPPIESMEQKMRHARALRDLGKKTTIVVDTLYGKVHRTYGGPSNMTVIVDHTGHLAYRAAWTVAEDIEEALEEILEIRERRREGKRVSTYYREIQGIKRGGLRGPQVFLGGNKAEEDFAKFRNVREEPEP